MWAAWSFCCGGADNWRSLVEGAGPHPSDREVQPSVVDGSLPDGRVPVQRFPVLVLTYCWVGLGPRMAGCTAWGPRGAVSLQVGEWVPGDSGPQEDSKTALPSAGVITEGGAPRVASAVSLSPAGVPFASRLSDSLSQINRWHWDSQCERFCVCPLRVESLFPVALGVSLLDVKVRYSGGSSSCCRSPWLGSLMWGQTPHCLGRTSAAVTFLLFVGIQPGGCRAWLSCLSAPPTQFFLCIFSCGKIVENLSASLQVIFKGSCWVSSWDLVCPWQKVSSGSFLLCYLGHTPYPYYY